MGCHAAEICSARRCRPCDEGATRRDASATAPTHDAANDLRHPRVCDAAPVYGQADSAGGPDPAQRVAAHGAARSADSARGPDPTQRVATRRYAAGYIFYVTRGPDPAERVAARCYGAARSADSTRGPDSTQRVTARNNLSPTRRFRGIFGHAQRFTPEGTTATNAPRGFDEKVGRR